MQCLGVNSVTSAIRVLSVGFAELQQAPTILDLNTVSLTTSITALVQLSSSGNVYCAAFEQKGSTVPSPNSVSEVILQNNVGVTDSDNRTVITMSGLFAATNYQVYCMSVSPIGVQMTLPDMLLNAIGVSTDCCNAVVIESSAAFVAEGTVASRFLTITLPTRPRQDLQIRVAAFDEATTELTSNPFFPSVFSVKGADSGGSIELTAALLDGLGAGAYSYEVSFVGRTAHKYEAIYTRSNTVDILSATQPLPAPVLSTAAFVSDGSFVVITFDSKTDKGAVANEFSCSELFDFSCAETSTCRWSSSSKVNAYLDKSAGCATLNDPLTLSQDASIKALCDSEDCDTSSWDSAAAVDLSIALPSNPISPKIAIASPSSIGGCDSLALDISGSTGSGGREWAEVALTVESTATRNVTDLQEFLRNEYKPFPPTPVPAELLQKGFSYNFAVKLCNFLGQCSTGSRRVSILSTVIPSLTLPGSALRTTRRSSVLSISSDAFVVDCDGSTSRAGLSYQWNVKRNGVLDLSIRSTSKDPSKLNIAAYTLTVGAVYNVFLTVTITENLQSASASVTVVVEEGSIVATIAGGSSRTMRVTENLLLDASASYDEDQKGVTGSSAGLQFAWSCVQVAPTYISNCDAVFNSSAIQTSSSPTYSIIALASAANSAVEISLSLLDRSLSRAADATVSVSVLPALAPVVTLVSNLGASAVMNKDQQLKLTGTVSFPVGYGGTAAWSADNSDSLDLSTSAKSPLGVSFLPSSSAATPNTVYLVLASNSLPAGFALTFYLTAHLSTEGVPATTSVTVRVNSPPLPGRFFVTPDSGVELNDPFKFVASAWSDQDIPFQYQFGYLSTAGAYTVLSSKSQSAFGESQLPAGVESDGYVIVCVAEIFDSYLAASTAYDTVTVRKGAERNSSETLQYIESIIGSGSASADGIKQSNALGAYLLNSVNCSLAPNCAALNRADCFRTAHTCGDCVSSDFLGEEGDSNQACVAVTAFGSSERRLSGRNGGSALACSYSSECIGFESCVNGLCAAPQKQCVGNCSGHGTCVFVDSKFGKDAV